MQLLTNMTSVDLLLVIRETMEERNECFVGCFMIAMLHCYMDILPGFIYNDEEMLKKNNTVQWDSLLGHWGMQT